MRTSSFRRIRAGANWLAHDPRAGKSREARKQGRLRLVALEDRLVPAVAEFMDPHPVSGNKFGTSVVALSTGNVVVTAPFDDAAGADAGAVYLFNGSTGALISTLRGAKSGDKIGSGGVVALTNGNFVVISADWDNGAAVDAGAVTWGSGKTGVSGSVSAANSLVGSTAGDAVGSKGAFALAGGNYVVASPNWDSGAIADVGAATWGNGATGTIGVVGAANSLVGSAAGDAVSSEGVAVLGGNYVVISATWDNGAATDAGAATWGSGAAGVKGAVSAANSLVGGSAGDMVGVGGIVALKNGNYVVRSTVWRNGAATNAGAATWGSGSTGVVGLVGAANSLVGSTANDNVGSHGIFALPNGNYVVCSPTWDGAGIIDLGAATWGSGTAGVKGAVGAANSLVGVTASDGVGSDIAVLTNGNYVVRSSLWDNGKTGADAGAVTWANGLTGITGPVSVSNSLVGGALGDNIGIGGIVALTNGNYVVRSFYWDSAAAVDGGAVTWGNGATGITGLVSEANSLVGNSPMDYVGMGNVVALANGNYVVASQLWDNGSIANTGAVTWGNGATGTIGAVSPANSLVGSSADDFVGFGTYGVVALANGNYVVTSYVWDNGAKVNAGAVTWGNGATGITGAVSTANSLYGGASNDNVGGSGVVALANGNYVVRSALADVGGFTNAGAVTWGSGTSGVAGQVTALNSLVGQRQNDSIGLDGFVAFANGNFAVVSAGWDNGATVNAGAVTWGNGAGPTTGVVSSANSLVGSTANSKLQATLVIDGVNNNYISRFIAEGGGRVRVGSQQGVVSGTLSAQFVGGDLVITDVSPAGVNNRITLSYANGNYVINETNDTFINGPVGSQVSGDRKTLSVPGAAFPGKIVINGQAGSDLFTVVGLASTLTKPVVVNAGSGADQLTLTSGEFATLAVTYSNPADGTIVADPLGDDPPQTLTFTGVEPIDLSGVSAADLSFALPAASTSAVLEDNGSVGDGLLRLRSATGAPAPVTFASPLNSLAITDDANDSLTVSALPDFTRTLNLGSPADPFGQITLAGEVTIGPSFGLSAFAASGIALANHLKALGGDVELRSGAGITQMGGSVQVAGTLTIEAGPGASATFDAAGNAATNLVVPAGTTLIVNGSFDSAGAVQVAGQLGGNGSVGVVTFIDAGGFGSDSASDHLVTGDVAFNADSTFRIALNDPTDYEFLTANGLVTLAGASLSVSLGFTPALGQVFTILENKPGGETITGNFAGLSEGSFFTVDGYTFLLSYLGGDGNDVTLTRIDIPSAPAVDGIFFGSGAQRSIVKQIAVTFTEPISFTGPAAAAFKLHRKGTGGTLGDVLLNVSPTAGPTSSVTISFFGPLTQNGSLVDGLYDFTIDATKISGLGGSLDGNSDGTPGGNFSISGTTANKWFRLFGDNNGDSFTDNLDLLAFRNANGSNSSLGNFNPAFDFNGDGFIDNVDFLAFRPRLGAVV